MKPNNMLAHQLPSPLVPFDSFWGALGDVFQWLGGGRLRRYAGANRLKVEVHYRAIQGRQGPRIVEPYALRRDKKGDLLLFVVNDQGFLRSYRVDHIAAIRPTSETFIPRYRVEF